MSSLLQQAVDLAQAGQRDEARRLLWQFLQSNPDHEVAWLWLASVAADQPEYVRALNEVLRIDPTHQRARQLLDDFQRQYGSVPGASTPPFARSVPPAAQQGPPGAPPSPPPSPPPTPAYQPPPPAQQPAQPQPQQPYMFAQPESIDYGAEPVEPRKVKEREVERVVERRRRGCMGCGVPGCGCLGCGGCWQGCLVAVVLLIVLPALLCGALSFASFSLGPLDWLGTFLPGDFGSKTIKFESGQYEFTFDAPRSWYLVSEQNDSWLFARDVLNQAAKFDDPTRDWEDYENQTSPVIVETNPIALHMNGAPITLTLGEETGGDYACASVRGTATYDAITEYANGLCGYTVESLEPYTGSTVIVDATPPLQLLTVTFVVPVDADTGFEWSLVMAEDMQSFYRNKLDRLVESMEIKQK